MTAYPVDFRRDIIACTNFDMVKDILDRGSRALGFQLYAISRHSSPCSPGGAEILHNYPAGWEARYRSEHLEREDPVHRACQWRASGFRWREQQQSPRDEAMFDAARTFGIDDGFTIPGNVYGAARGSVTFATEVGARFPEESLFSAQAFGNFVFQKMLDLGWNRHLPRAEILTDRQLECVMWVGRGKCTWVIAQLMGISVNTVKKHLAEACERYEVATRSILPIKALYFGALQMTDLFR